MAKFKTLDIKLLHANVQCVCIVHVKYQKASVKALVQADFPIHALSEQYKTLIKKQSVKKMAMFKMLSFCQNVILWHQTSSCKCSMCLHCVCKVSDDFSKSSGTSWFPRACTIWALTNPNIEAKFKKKWLSSKHCQFVKKYFYGVKLLHANVQCVYIVYAKYQMASVKAPVGADFLAHVLSSTIQNYKGQ